MGVYLHSWGFVSLHFLQAKEMAGWKGVALPLQLYHKGPEGE